MSLSLVLSNPDVLCTQRYRKASEGKGRFAASLLARSSFFLLPGCSRSRNRDTNLLEATISNEADYGEYDLSSENLSSIEFFDDTSESIAPVKEVILNKSKNVAMAQKVEKEKISAKSSTTATRRRRKRVTAPETAVMSFTSDGIANSELKTGLDSSSSSTFLPSDMFGSSENFIIDSFEYDSKSENESPEDIAAQIEQLELKESQNTAARQLFADPRVLDYLELYGLTHDDISIPQYIGHYFYNRKLEDVKPTFDWLVKDLEITGDALKKVIRRNPSIFTKKLGLMKSKLDWISKTLCIPKSKYGYIISRNMNFINASIENNILRKVKYLLELGVSRERLCAMIAIYPQFLSLGMPNILATVEWFRSYCGCNDAQIANLVSRMPNVLNCSVEKKLKINYDYFVNDVGLTPEEVRKLIVVMPAVLVYKTSTLQEKLNFLVDNGYSKKEAFDKPFFFGLSVDRRLKCRIAYLEHLGMDHMTQVPGQIFFLDNENFTRSVTDTNLEHYLQFQQEFVKKISKTKRLVN